MEQTERPRLPYIVVLGRATGSLDRTGAVIAGFTTGMDIGIRLGLEHPKEAMAMLMEYRSIADQAGIPFGDATEVVKETVEGWYEHLAGTA